MEESASQRKQSEAQAGRQENISLVHPPQEVDSTQVWRLHLGKEQGDAQDKQNKQPITENQATYARLVAQLAFQADIKGWCALAWLALGFQAMAEPTIPTIMQAIFTLTFLFRFFPLLTSLWDFYQLLEYWAPSYWALYCRLCQTKLSARINKNSKKKKEAHENWKKKKKKQKPTPTHLLVMAAF